MIFVFLLHSAFCVRSGGSTFDFIGAPFHDEGYSNEDINMTKYDSLNQTLIDDIRKAMNQINQTLNYLKNGSKNINESLQFLINQFELITSSMDIEELNQTIIQLEKLSSDYSKEVNRITSEVVNKLINEKLVYKEIIVNYVPKRNIKFIKRSEIKPLTEPPFQDNNYPNFTFETLRPYAAKKIIFDNYLGAGNSLVTEANLIFYLKGRTFSPPLKFYISGKENTTVKLQSPALFDKFVIQSLQKLGESDNYTIPTFHVYEPGRIQN